MPWVIAIVAALALLVVLAGCRPASTTPPPPPPPGGTAEKSPEASLSTREGIIERLKLLEKSEPPKELKRGAMCYDMAAPPSTADYVCPKCGEKTVYALGEPPASFDLPRRVEWELPACRRLIGQIPVAWVTLDESQFCGKCSPGIGAPEIVLVVRIPGEAEPHRTAGIRSDDLVLVQEFLSGADRHRGDNDGESPMKSHLKRIEELLGVKP